MPPFNSNGNGQPNYNEEPLRVIIRGMSDKFDSHVTKMDEHIKKTDRLNNIVFGDKEAKIPGLAYKVDKNTRYIAADKKIKWIGAGTMLAGGAGMGFWDKIVHWFKLM